SRSGRGNLRLRRGAQGRIRRLSGDRRRQPSLSPQDQGAWLRASPRDGPPDARPHARGRVRNHWLARHCVWGDRSLSRRRFHEPADHAPFAFTQATEDQIAWWERKYPSDRRWSAVIPALWVAQKQNGGWLSEPAMRAV